jgi:hypothetical protein
MNMEKKTSKWKPAVLLIIAGMIIGFGIGTHAQAPVIVSHLLSQITTNAGQAVDVDDDGIIDQATIACGIGINCTLDTADLLDGTVTTPKLADGSVTTNKIGDASISTPKIQDNAVTSAKIPNATISTAHILNNTIIAQDVDDTQVQLRVGGSCAVGSAIKQINSDGTVACETIPSAILDGKDVKVSTTDTTPGFLTSKLVAGTNITLVKGNSGANETLTITSNPPAPTYSFITATDTSPAADGTGYELFTATATCTGATPRLLSCSGGFNASALASSLNPREFTVTPSGSGCTVRFRTIVTIGVTATVHAYCSS